LNKTRHETETETETEPETNEQNPSKAVTKLSLMRGIVLYFGLLLAFQCRWPNEFNIN